MTARKPYSDATALLGKKLDGTDARRDAVHLACEPVKNETSKSWYPSDAMTFGETGKLRQAREGEEVIGIIDPFLRVSDDDPDSWVSVDPGETCFLILMPGAVTSLRHVWTHPQFKDLADEPGTPKAKAVKAEKTEEEISEIWLREYADEHGVDYEEMMSAARSHIVDPDGWNYVSGGSAAEGAYTGEEFWHHVGILLGIEVQPEQQGSIITCSC